MRGRAAAGVLFLIAVASLASIVVRLRTAPSPRPTAAVSARSAPAPLAAPSPPPFDPDRLRDVFRFGDEAAAKPEAGTEPATSRMAAEQPTGPRLVGLVRRSNRLLAALDVDGEIGLAAAGESVAGVTVLSVSEEAVRIRDAGGAEAVLPY